MGRKPFYPSTEARFWAHVEKTDTCWLWTAAQTQPGWGHIGGYGIFGVYEPTKRKVKAHRFAFELSRGAIPTGLDLDHICSIRNCVNPAHLEPVTRSENVRRGHARKAA